MVKQTHAYNIERPEPVVIPPTSIMVPSVDDTVSFAHPFAGPNTYQHAGKSILENKTAKQSLPNGEQTAYLFHAAYLGPEAFTSQSEPTELRDKVMRRNYLWVFNQNLWTPEGVYVAFDPEAIGLSRNLDANELENSLKNGRELSNGVRLSNSRAIAFAPKESYKLGDHTPESFAQDGFVIATFGERGAEKMAEVSEKFKYNPRTWGVEVSEDNDPVQKVSAVGGYGDGLYLDGGFVDDYRDGYASGVLD
jgi:hypothetical protein